MCWILSISNNFIINKYLQVEQLEVSHPTQRVPMILAKSPVSVSDVEVAPREKYFLHVPVRTNSIFSSVTFRVSRVTNLPWYNLNYTRKIVRDNTLIQIHIRNMKLVILKSDIKGL